MSFSAEVGPFVGTKAGRGQWELITATVSPTDNASASAITSGSPGVTWTTNNWDGSTAVATVTLTLTGTVEDLFCLTPCSATLTTTGTTAVGSFAIWQSQDVSAKTMTWKLIDVDLAGGSGDELAYIASAAAPVGVSFRLALMVKRSDGRIG